MNEGVNLRNARVTSIFPIVNKAYNKDKIIVRADGKFEYRGLIWGNDSELSRLLNKSASYVAVMMFRYHKTRRQIIDYNLEKYPELVRQ